MGKIYYLFEIAFKKVNYDKIFELLYLEGIETIHEGEDSIKIFFEEKDLPGLGELKKRLLKLPALTENDIYIGKFENYDWNLEWEKSIEPVFIKDRIIIYPSWKRNELAEFKNRILIEIDPKMSFGTGHSETTQIMLEMLCDYINENDKFLLDYGCGTAVLAIAGIKLGMEKAAAIDVDEVCIQNAGEYIKNNSVSSSIKLYKADISEIKENGFDVIVSNINRTVITRNLNIMHSKLKHSGKLFISGILREEENELLMSLEKNRFELIETRKSADWLSFYCRSK